MQTARGARRGQGGGRSLIISDSIPCFEGSYTDQFVHPLNYPSNCGYQFVTRNISTMAPEEEIILPKLAICITLYCLQFILQ